MRLHADNSKCSGCRACLVACSSHLFRENNPRKAALTIISSLPLSGEFAVKVCTQCGACAEACPTEAIILNARDAYYVEPSRCNLCMSCVEACPEGVVFHREDVPHTWKCDLCGDCVLVCGPGALWIAGEEVE
jgi:carbon-monoxide dehydrogenase iron sulfur subunit